MKYFRRNSKEPVQVDEEDRLAYQERLFTLCQTQDAPLNSIKECIENGADPYFTDEDHPIPAFQLLFNKGNHGIMFHVFNMYPPTKNFSKVQSSIIEYSSQIGNAIFDKKYAQEDFENKKLELAQKYLDEHPGILLEEDLPNLIEQEKTKELMQKYRLGLADDAQKYLDEKNTFVDSNNREQFLKEHFVYEYIKKHPFILRELGYDQIKTADEVKELVINAARLYDLRIPEAREFLEQNPQLGNDLTKDGLAGKALDFALNNMQNPDLLDMTINLIAKQNPKLMHQVLNRLVETSNNSKNIKNIQQIDALIKLYNPHYKNAGYKFGVLSNEERDNLKEISNIIDSREDQQNFDKNEVHKDTLVNLHENYQALQGKLPTNLHGRINAFIVKGTNDYLNEQVHLGNVAAIKEMCEIAGNTEAFVSIYSNPDHPLLTVEDKFTIAAYNQCFDNDKPNFDKINALLDQKPSLGNPEEKWALYNQLYNFAIENAQTHPEILKKYALLVKEQHPSYAPAMVIELVEETNKLEGEAKQKLSSFIQDEFKDHMQFNNSQDINDLLVSCVMGNNLELYNALKDKNKEHKLNLQSAQEFLTKPQNAKLIHDFIENSNDKHLALEVNAKAINKFLEKNPQLATSEMNQEEKRDLAINILGTKIIGNTEGYHNSVNELIKDLPYIDNNIAKKILEDQNLINSLSKDNLNKLAPYLKEELKETKASKDGNQELTNPEIFLYRLIVENGKNIETGDQLRENVSEAIFGDKNIIPKENTNDPFDEYIKKKESYNDDSKLHILRGVRIIIKAIREKKSFKESEKEYKAAKLKTRANNVRKSLLDSATQLAALRIDDADKIPPSTSYIPRANFTSKGQRCQ
ncbi:MAG: hypothetical protein AABY27_02415 [Pseudomonadota bacterium]